MSINPDKLAKNTRRIPEKTVVVNSAVSEEEIDELRRTIDELNFRLMTAEVRINTLIAEVNFHNVYWKYFRDQFNVMYKKTWYRCMMWAVPRFGLAPYPERPTIGVIIIRDRKPRM